MRRRPLILTAIGLAALVIAYAVYWFMLARIVAQDIAGWTGFYRSQGYAVSYEVPPLSGFPFAVTARFLHPDVAAPDGHWRWQGEEVRLRIQPWAPYELQFTGLGSQKLSIAGTQAREIAITADLLGLDVHLKDGLEADRFGFTLTHGAIDDSRIGKTLVESLTADGRFPAPPPTDATRSSLDLIAHLARLTLPPGVDAPLGREIYSAHLVAQVMGPIPPGPPREALPAWSAAGGDVELREVQLLWGGLWLKGDATLAFDKALQPLFAGSFAIANIGSLLDKLVTAGILPVATAQGAKIMFAALATTPSEGGPPQVKLPLTIQDGTLYMGPIKLAALRPLDWSWLP